MSDLGPFFFFLGLLHLESTVLGMGMILSDSRLFIA